MYTAIGRSGKTSIQMVWYMVVGIYGVDATALRIPD